MLFGQDGLVDVLMFLYISLICRRMPCCYLLPYVFNAHLLLLAYCQLVTTEQRFERHALPTDHIVVHSSYSNVSVADWVVVTSDESKIEFYERFLYGKIWSGNSTLNFESHGQAENFSAHNDVLSIFELSQMFLTTNRSTDGHSYMEYRADMNVSLIFSSDVIQVNAFSGRWAHVSAVTWQLPIIPGRVTIGSNILNDLNRQLDIISLSSNYNINMTIFDAQMQMRYGNITVQIASDYRFLRIRSGLYVINLKTVVSPFEMSISDHEMIVLYKNERTIVQLLPNSSNIIISTNQYSRVVIDRGREAVVLGGRELRPTGNINLLSMQLKILLKSGNISFIHTSANHSQITMQTTSTNMASTAAHHDVDFIGGKIDLNVFTGNVSMNIITNTHLELLPTMLTPFLTPQNNFHDLRMHTNHNFSTDERNNSTNLVSVTQVPLTMASHSVSDERNDFPAEFAATTDDHIYKSILESTFMIPLLPRLTMSTVKPTSTVSLVLPKQSSIAILANRTTSTPSSSPGNAALSHFENTSHTSFITKTTKTERMDTSMDTFNWPKVSETAAASIISLNTSTVASPSILATLRTMYSSSSFSLTNVSSNILSSSSATILSNISLGTLTSNRTTEIIISNLPAVVSGKEYSDDENNEYVQTDFIEFSWDNIGKSSIPITTTATVISTTALTDEGQNLAPEKMRSTECIDIDSSKKQNTPLLTAMATSKAARKPIVVETNRSVGSAWTPFASLPFEFPPTARYLFTASFRKGNFILHNGEAKNEITFDRNEISKDKNCNKSAVDASSVPMITALEEFFGKIVQRGSERKKSQNNYENPGFGQQQNFFSSSKLRRALSSFANEEIYEIQLKVPFGINLTAIELHRELLLALKKFVLFTNLHERRLPISEDAIRIKITNVKRSGEYLKVLYSVSINTKMISYANGCDDGINEASNCAQNYGFSGIELLLVIMGILIVVLFCTGTLLGCHKHCYKFVGFSIKN